MALGILGLFCLTGCPEAGPGEAPRRTWSFPAGETKTVLVRSWRAQEARVVIRGGATVEISARPKLQANSYHGPEPDWRTTRPHEWPFSWESQRQGSELALSSQGEARLPHHRYVLEELVIAVPPGVKVKGERKELEVRPQ